MADAAAVVEVKAIEKTYTMGDVEVRALRGVSLAIHKGDFVAVMGASGSGKSTFMNLVGCLDKPTRGNYFLGGIDVGKLSRDQLARVRGQQIGFVFQGFNLLPRTSAVENVELPMLYQGVGGKERQQRGAAGPARGGGTRPPLLPAADPPGTLASRTSVEVMSIFQELNDQGLTVLLVTHEPDIAEHARRVVTFKDGVVLSDVQVSPRKIAREELTKLDAA